MIDLLTNNFNEKKNFILAGCVNSIVGYFIGITIYNLLYELYGIYIFGIVSNFLSISFSFFSMKYFVFKSSKGNWFYQYIKSFLTYGLSAIIGFMVIYICIKIFNLNIYISQAISIFSVVIISYFGHKNYTFKN